MRQTLTPTDASVKAERGPVAGLDPASADLDLASCYGNSALATVQRPVRPRRRGRGGLESRQSSWKCERRRELHARDELDRALEALEREGRVRALRIEYGVDRDETWPVETFRAKAKAAHR